MKRTDIKKTSIPSELSANYWEDACSYELSAEAPMTEADIAEFFGGWTFPIVRHGVELAADGMGAKVHLVYDNCD